MTAVLLAVAALGAAVAGIALLIALDLACERGWRR
jgi:hypothetical protein